MKPSDAHQVLYNAISSHGMVLRKVENLSCNLGMRPAAVLAAALDRLGYEIVEKQK